MIGPTLKGSHVPRIAFFSAPAEVYECSRGSYQTDLHLMNFSNRRARAASRIDNRWRDRAARSPPPRHIGLFVAVEAPSQWRRTIGADLSCRGDGESTPARTSPCRIESSWYVGPTDVVRIDQSRNSDTERRRMARADRHSDA
jgi:hypothetical protein